MDRRVALKSITAPAAGAILNQLAGGLVAAAAVPAEPSSERTPALAAYEKLRFGCSFHFGLPTFTGDDYDV